MTIRVLLVDADDAAREGLRIILESEAGFLVAGEAADGRAALRAAARLSPDVVVMAASLPVADGIQTTRRLRQHRRVTAVPVLLISEDDSAEQLIEGIRAGAYGFVRKRVRSDTLLRAVRALAGGGGYLGPTVTRQFLDYASPRLPPAGGASQPALAALTARERDVLRMLARVPGQPFRPASGWPISTAKGGPPHRSRPRKSAPGRPGQQSDPGEE